MKKDQLINKITAHPLFYFHSLSLMWPINITIIKLTFYCKQLYNTERGSSRTALLKRHPATQSPQRTLKSCYNITVASETYPFWAIPLLGTHPALPKRNSNYVQYSREREALSIHMTRNRSRRKQANKEILSHDQTKKKKSFNKSRFFRQAHLWFTHAHTHTYIHEKIKRTCIMYFNKKDKIKLSRHTHRYMSVTNIFRVHNHTIMI